EHRDEVAPFHCTVPPVLPTETIAQQCCAAGFQFDLCLLRVHDRSFGDVSSMSGLPPKADLPNLRTAPAVRLWEPAISPVWLPGTLQNLYSPRSFRSHQRRSGTVCSGQPEGAHG